MARGPVIGLDIGTSAVRAAELSHGRGKPTLERFGQVGLPSGAVRDGEVVDRDAVAAAIRELWSQVKFSSKKVVVGVSNQKVVVRQVDLPWLPPAELKASLAFHVQDAIPIPVDQAVLDCHPLQELTSDGGVRTVRVLLVAAGREMVDGLIAAVTQAGLRPTRVDLTSFAVLRAQRASGADAMSTTSDALVDIGAAVTNIVVHQGDVPHFVRVLPMGGDDITGALAERLGVPLDQAEDVKQRSRLGAPDVDGNQPASRAIESVGGQLVDEVRGSLDYYRTQGGAVRIDRVVLSGGGARLDGLVERLSSATRLPVVLAQPFASLRMGKSGLTDEQLAFVELTAAVPVGLALAS